MATRHRTRPTDPEADAATEATQPAPGPGAPPAPRSPAAAPPAAAAPGPAPAEGRAPGRAEGSAPGPTQTPAGYGCGGGLPDLSGFDLAALRGIEHPVLARVIEGLLERVRDPAEILNAFDSGVS
ncbi:FxSxx-COOH cyclophane-containing RiPP peptide [Streptomyces sp. NPDC046866]|uniref:FxSxx-COOH cyclophane-containing RiPP peptide n=1 Tax=Streptomyces sp. NPDC046866 TaxID=3154921 RepID=UPI003454B9A0